MGELFDPAADYAVDVLRVVADGGTVVVECVTRSVARTGRPYENAIVAVFDVRDGRITGMREYFDTQHLRAALSD